MLTRTISVWKMFGGGIGLCCAALLSKYNHEFPRFQYLAEVSPTLIIEHCWYAKAALCFLLRLHVCDVNRDCMHLCSMRFNLA